MLYIVCNPVVADGIKVSVNVEENIKFNGLNTAHRTVLTYIFLILWFALILKKKIIIKIGVVRLYNFSVSSGFPQRNW